MSVLRYRDWRYARRAYAALLKEDLDRAGELLDGLCERNPADADLRLLRHTARGQADDLLVAWTHRASLGVTRAIIAPQRDFGTWAVLLGERNVWVEDEHTLALAVASVRAARGAEASSWAMLDTCPPSPDRDLLLAELCSRLGDYPRAIELAEPLIDDLGTSALHVAFTAALSAHDPELVRELLAGRELDANCMWGLVLACEDDPALQQHAAREAWDRYSLPEAATLLATVPNLTDIESAERWAALRPAPINP